MRIASLHVPLLYVLCQAVVVQKLDEVMESVGSDAVHFQQQFQPAEVRQLLASTTAGLDRKLVQVHQRIEKHLAATSPYLVDQVWDK